MSEHGDKQTAFAFFTTCVSNEYGSLKVVSLGGDSMNFFEGGFVPMEHKSNLWRVLLGGFYTEFSYQKLHVACNT